MTSLEPICDASDIPAEQDDHDIYRGDRQYTCRQQDTQSFTSSTSSTSGSSFIPGIGALAAVVEHAISRWARRNSSSSSSSSSTISSYSQRSSAVIHPRRYGRRRRARSTSVSMSAASERDISARIRARHESRQVPREFTLYLPPDMTPENRYQIVSQSRQDIFRGSSLPHVLSRLENALKRAAKSRRAKKPVLPLDLSSPSPVPAESSRGRGLHWSSTDVIPIRRSKGKQKMVTAAQSTPMPLDALSKAGQAPKAWWLDVANPTWDDMRTIGKLLHIHPLTLEDVLQRDTREKLELFPKLGYQFIVFRAMEGASTRERFRQRYGVDITYPDNEGSIGEANVYLVVFREGIVTFHFTDISEHIQRVRTRVQLLQDSFHMSSDWIAHGLLDSVVDSLFPILKEIQKEVAAIEAIVFSSGELDGSLSATIPTTPLVEDSTCNAEKDVEKIPSLSLIEKVEASTEIGPRFSVPRLTIPLAFRRLKRKITSFLENTLSTSSAYMVPSQSATTITLRRMARTRRLVTSLTRLLASKSEVVSQIRKRYLNASRAIQSDDLEIAMYMGDIQDHILALHQALSHYEHMLSEFHPAYLSQLRTRMSNANKGSGKAVLLLSVVSFAALVPGPIIGAFSMNVHTPRNTINNPVPSGGHYWFGIVLALVAFVECTFLTLVRWWWVQAKRTRRSKLS